MPVIRALKTDVAKLALPGGRMVGSEGHRLAEQYVLRRFEELGLAPYSGRSYRLPFVREGQELTNLAGVVRGKASAKAPVLVGAHYDSVTPSPCADDNAAAVSIALSAASILARRGPDPRRLPACALPGVSSRQPLARSSSVCASGFLKVRMRSGLRDDSGRAIRHLSMSSSERPR